MRGINLKKVTYLIFYLIFFYENSFKKLKSSKKVLNQLKIIVKSQKKQLVDIPFRFVCAISPLASFHVTASITLERESGKCNKRVWERNKGAHGIKFIIFTSDFWTAFVDENRWDKRNFLILPPSRLCHTIHHKNLLTHSELFHSFLVNSWHMARKKKERT